MASKKSPRPEPHPQKRGAGERAQPSGSDAGWLRIHWRQLGVVASIALLSGLWWVLPGSVPDAKIALDVAPKTATEPLSAGMNVPTIPASSAPVEQRRLELSKQLEELDHTLCTYREATKYPNTSRPISEHPDQVYPNRPVEEEHAMRKEGGGNDASVQIHTSQSRVYMVAGESVTLTIKAVSKEGKPMAIYINRALASGIGAQGGRQTPQLPLAIADDGRNGDSVANDGILSGQLAPAQSGFAAFAGTIRTELKYTVDGRAGVALFDVIYSPETPATWVGPIRESMEGGSLNFHLKTNVRLPGRYLVSGRVDDANGKPVALVTYNDLLAQGNGEIRLTVVGKLLRDQAPVFPLALRDVDAFLLKEDTDPDRALMPRLEGVAHVTKTYLLKNFSDAEWQSEERSRYLTEYSKDVDLAKAALVALNPEQARMPFPQSECSKGKTR
jgi:hypothetical protein